MNNKPAAPTSFRLSKAVKQLLAAAADRERRSQTGMLEVMVVDWCQRHRVKRAPRGAGN
jgi:hypothetical protein